MKKLIKVERYDCEIELIEKMLGTVCKNRELYKRFIESKKPEGVEEDEAETVEEIEEAGWDGFHSDGKGIFIYDYMIKGFLKSAAVALKDQIQLKAPKSKIDRYVHIKPRRIHFGKEKPDGTIERAIRCQTMRGERISLKRSDYVNEGAKLSFTIELITNKNINETMLRTMLEYGRYCGLGEWRNSSYGRFVVNKFERVK